MILLVIILAAAVAFQAGAATRPSSHCPQEEQNEQTPRGNLPDSRDHQPVDKTPKAE